MLYEGYILAVLNFANTLTNIYWSVKLKGIQSNKEYIASLREDLQEKDDLIKRLQRKKSEYKINYFSMLTKYKEAEGKLKTYQQFHNHIDAEPH